MRRMIAEVGIDLMIGLAVLSAVYWAVDKFGLYQPSHLQREAVGAAWEKNGFSVALVWPADRDTGFIDGATLAIDENNVAHNALSNKIRLRMFTETDIESGTQTAQQVSSYSDVVAVLGHEYSSSALGASLVYDNHGILFLAARPTSPRLTSHGFQFVFRMTPDDHAMAGGLAGFCKYQAYSKVALLYARTALGESLAPTLVSHLAKQHVEVSFYRSYLPVGDAHRQDYRALIADLLKESFDAILVVDELPRAANLVSDLRGMGIKQPIVGGETLDSSELWKIAGPAADGVYALSAESASIQTPEFLAFRRDYMRRYGSEPDYNASQGYESARLLIEAILESKSADPLILATTLRVGKWKGILGPFSFNHSGDIVGRNLYPKRLSGGVFAAVQEETEEPCCQH